MKRTIFIIILLLLSCRIAAADEFDYRAELDGFWGSGIIESVEESVPESARKFIEDNGGLSGAAEKITPKSLISGALAALRSKLTSPLRMLALLIGVILMYVLLSSFGHTLAGGSVSAVWGVIATVFIAALVIEPVIDCIFLVSETAAGYSDFITVFIPVFAGILTAAGQPLTAAAYNILLFFACQTTAALMSTVFVPLLCGYLALTVVSTAAPDMKLSSIASGIKSLVTWALTLILTLFTGLLSLQSAIAAGGDSVAVRTTRVFIGSFVPVVGRTLSDMFSAAQGCVELVRSTLGAAGIIVTAATFLPVFIEVAVWYITVYAGGIIAEIMGAPEMEKLLKGVSGTLGILMAVLLFYALLVIVATTLMIVVFRGG